MSRWVIIGDIGHYLHNLTPCTGFYIGHILDFGFGYIGLFGLFNDILLEIFKLFTRNFTYLYTKENFK